MHFGKCVCVCACCFWPALPGHWVPGRWPDNSVICLDLHRTTFMTLTPIYQISMTALGQWINNPLKRIFRKDGTFTWFDFISSKHQQLFCFSRKSLWATHKVEITAHLFQLKSNLLSSCLCALFHWFEWSWFPLSCSHLSKSWHQTRSTQVCSNQSQLVMDTKHPVKEL